MFKISTKILLLAFTLCLPAIAAGTNVSSGISWSIGTSHGNVTEWSTYASQGQGYIASCKHDESGYDYRKEVYQTAIQAGTTSNGLTSGEFTSMNYSSSAGILKTTVGTTTGSSVLAMDSSSWGETITTGHYMQTSVQDNSYNYEEGYFIASSGYAGESTSYLETAYTLTYSDTEFNH